MLVRDLSNASIEAKGDYLRAALSVAQIPERMICLVVREKAPPVLRASFPGSSVSFDVAETQVRQETNASAHLLPLSGNQIMPNDMNSRGAASPVASDFVALFEALGRIIGMKGLVLEPLVAEAPEQGRNRPGFVLTERAREALTVVFKEACGSNQPGLGQQDIEAYLQKCGLDSSAVPPQKIVEILTKYQTVSSEGAKGTTGSYLSLQGFLAYYRDMAQTDDSRVRSDLHTFGFRPDLSRRSPETRIFTTGGRDQLMFSAESVAKDVATTMQSDVAQDMSELALMGLDVFLLYQYAYSACEPLAEYLLATTAYERDCNSLIVNTLRTIYNAPTSWAGNEIWGAATMVLKILSSIEDDYKRERISAIMQTTRTGMAPDEGLGLLGAAKVFAGSRSAHNYSADMQYSYERYVEILKELLKLSPIYLWMSEHRALWSWMERDLFSTDDGKSQRRTYDSGRRDGTGKSCDWIPN